MTLAEPAADLPVIYLIRHGETRANVERRYEGTGDGDLTERGRRQAQRIALLLASSDLRAVYSSPKLRAFRTAEAIAARHRLTPVVMEGLAEVDFGEWEGLTYEEVQGRDPERLEGWLADPVHCRPPGGESLADMWRRVRQCMAEILRVQSTTTGAPGRRAEVAVVSHGGPIRAILSFSECGDLSAFWSPTVAPGEVRPVPGGRLRDVLRCPPRRPGSPHNQWHLCRERPGEKVGRFRSRR